MSEIITTDKKADMTREEAQHALAQLRGTEERQKELLLEMHTRNAHKAMGYKTWPEFADGTLGMGKSRFYQLLEAARVERTLQEIVDKILKSSRNVDSSNQVSTKFNDEMLLELAKIKDPEKMICAAQEALDAASTMAYRGKDSRFNGQLRVPLVKGIVNRILSEPQKPIVNHAELEARGVPPVAPAPAYVAPPLISTPVSPADSAAPKTRFDEAVETSDTRTIIATAPVSAPAVKPAPTPVEKYTRGVTHDYITCRWDDDDEVLRVVFRLADGSEGAVLVPGGFLP